MTWYTSGKKAKAGRIERKLRRMAKKLYKMSKRYGYTYADVYFLTGSEGTRTIDVRVKAKDKVVFDSYAFIK